MLGKELKTSQFGTLKETIINCITTKPPTVEYPEIQLDEKILEYRTLMKETKESLGKSKENVQYGLFLPLMRHGITVYQQHHRQVLILGNTVVWYGSLIGVISYLSFKVFSVLGLQRGLINFTGIQGIKEMDHHVCSGLAISSRI